MPTMVTVVKLRPLGWPLDRALSKRERTQAEESAPGWRIQQARDRREAMALRRTARRLEKRIGRVSRAIDRWRVMMADAYADGEALPPLERYAAVLRMPHTRSLVQVARKIGPAYRRRWRGIRRIVNVPPRHAGSMVAVAAFPEWFARSRG